MLNDTLLKSRRVWIAKASQAAKVQRKKTNSDLRKLYKVMQECRIRYVLVKGPILGKDGRQIVCGIAPGNLLLVDANASQESQMSAMVHACKLIADKQGKGGMLSKLRKGIAKQLLGEPESESAAA